MSDWYTHDFILLSFPDCGSGVVLKGLGCYLFLFIWGSFPNAVEVCRNRKSSIVAVKTAIEERAVIGMGLLGGNLEMKHTQYLPTSTYKSIWIIYLVTLEQSITRQMISSKKLHVLQYR